jgi:phage portal protein BeeE
MSLSFHFTGDMTPDEYKANANRVRDTWSGPGNSGKIGVTAGGDLKINDMGSNNRDMDYLNAMKLVQQTCAQLYHIPLPIVSTDAQTFNNYGTAILSLWDDAIIPLSGRIFAGLGELLLPRFGLDPSEVRITFDHEDIQPLRERRDAELDRRVTRNLETHDELRAVQGLGEYEPTEKPGGTILVSSAQVPLGDDLFGDASQDVPDFGAPDDDNPADSDDPDFDGPDGQPGDGDDEL